MEVGVKLAGGIGNTLFQYATARALALHNEAALYVDKTYYDNPNRPWPFPYELDDFQIEASVKLRHGKQIREPHYHYSPGIIREHKEDVFLDGYFQSEKYFCEYRDIIIGDFALKNRPSFLCQQWEKTIRECDFPVAVHIRRGERVKHKRARQTHGLVPAEYYMEAMGIIEAKASKIPTHILFTDDPVWAVENIKTKVVVGTSAPEDIYLMSLCKGAIIPNSSFGWFGAYLQRPGNIVVAPKNWDAGRGDNDKDVIPDRWNKLKVKYL